jgi:hypothetical protein
MKKSGTNLKASERLPANPGAEPVLMEVPSLQGTKPITTTSAWIRGGWTGGAPDASTLATATPITNRRPLHLLDAMAMGTTGEAVVR